MFNHYKERAEWALNYYEKIEEAYLVYDHYMSFCDRLEVEILRQLE